MEEFGYPYKGAAQRLYLLGKEKLVVNIDRDEWTLTERGYERLDYYGKLEV